MSSDFIILCFIIIEIIGGFIFWKTIKYFNYDLHFKESLLFVMPTLLLTMWCLVDFKLLNINLDFRLNIEIISYCLGLLLLYYIIRSIKLKIYIPLKIIISYIFVGFTTTIVLGNVLDKTTNIDGLNALALWFIYIAMSVGFIGVLLLQNFFIFIIQSLSKNKSNV
jgi:hypothetical protein